MKKALSAAVVATAMGLATAHAADIPRPVYKAPVAVPAQFSWTGFYIGGHVGGKRGRADYGSVREVLFPGFVTVGGIPGIAPIVIVPSRFATLPGVSSTNTGFVGGGQIGYNWQVSNWVFGLEADANWNRVRPSVGFNVPDPFLIQTLTGSYTTEIDWTASLRARLGVTFDRLLIYATAAVLSRVGG